MARGINKAILIGNLGQDPEIRHTPGGAAIANVTIATSDSWRDKTTNELQERTEWHRIVFFNRLAEIAGEYLRKGSRIYVCGRIQTRKWQDKSGADRYTTEIVASEMQMLDRKSDGDPSQFTQAQPARQQTRNAPGPMPPAEAPATMSQGMDDDDVPF